MKYTSSIKQSELYWLQQMSDLFPEFALKLPRERQCDWWDFIDDWKTHPG